MVECSSQQYSFCKREFDRVLDEIKEVWTSKAVCAKDQASLKNELTEFMATTKTRYVQYKEENDKHFKQHEELKTLITDLSYEIQALQSFKRSGKLITGLIIGLATIAGALSQVWTNFGKH